jgi:hypothetical protein
MIKEIFKKVDKVIAIIVKNAMKSSQPQTKKVTYVTKIKSRIGQQSHGLLH